MRTFGPLMAFLRLWIAILVIYPVQQAIMAWVFGQYIIYPFFGDCTHDELPTKLLTSAGIAILTYINCRSTKVGTYTNNVFTMSKVLALCLLILIGFYTMYKGKINIESVKILSKLFLCFSKFCTVKNSFWKHALFFTKCKQIPKCN